MASMQSQLASLRARRSSVSKTVMPDAPDMSSRKTTEELKSQIVKSSEVMNGRYSETKRHREMVKNVQNGTEQVITPTRDQLLLFGQRDSSLRQEIYKINIFLAWCKEQKVPWPLQVDDLKAFLMSKIWEGFQGSTVRQYNSVLVKWLINGPPENPRLTPDNFAVYKLLICRKEVNRALINRDPAQATPFTLSEDFWKLSEEEKSVILWFFWSGLRGDSFASLTSTDVRLMNIQGDWVSERVSMGIEHDKVAKARGRQIFVGCACKMVVDQEAAKKSLSSFVKDGGAHKSAYVKELKGVIRNTFCPIHSLRPLSMPVAKPYLQGILKKMKLTAHCARRGLILAIRASLEKWREAAENTEIIRDVKIVWEALAKKKGKGSDEKIKVTVEKVKKLVKPSMEALRAELHLKTFFNISVEALAARFGWEKEMASGSVYTEKFIGAKYKTGTFPDIAPVLQTLPQASSLSTSLIAFRFKTRKMSQKDFAKEHQAKFLELRELQLQSLRDQMELGMMLPGAKDDVMKHMADMTDQELVNQLKDLEGEMGEESTDDEAAIEELMGDVMCEEPVEGF